MAWKKLYVLGAGSYGKVYYAVKIDSYGLCASVAAVKCADFRRSISLQQEAQILTTLRGCPYVVQFFGADASIENAGDGMAYMTGTSTEQPGHSTMRLNLDPWFSYVKLYIWSLGALRAEMMTGSCIWIYHDTKDLQWKIMNEDPMIQVRFRDCQISWAVQLTHPQEDGRPSSCSNILLFSKLYVHRLLIRCLKLK
ncbi:hypothetical protein HAX54_047166 [Datura stramonium]|uniref:Protein kinase domain-containing protein n=1 Tax=Datura stramonium TaxID=4076 RepID=A0ABS8SS79_DATST|nr:hypothetical protein [Datura stramonium]